MNDFIRREVEKYLSKKNVYFHKFSKELCDYLNDKFQNLPSIKSRWYMLKHNLTEIPVCQLPRCCSYAKWNERTNQFDAGCCTDHIKRITSINNFGTEHPNQSKKQQQKVKNSIREKYGVDFITQTDKHKQSVQKTVLSVYGVDSVLRSPEVREKIKKTNIDRYGCEYPSENKEIRNKIQSTNLIRYGVKESLSSVDIREKGNKTNLEKYGTIFPMRNIDVLDRRKKFIIEKYDSYSPFTDKEISNKSKKSHWTRYYTTKLLTNKFVMPMFTLEEYIGTKNSKHYSWKCKTCDSIFVDNVANGHLPRCPTCFPKNYYVSNGETSLFASIDCEKIQSNRDLIPPYEIDIYLPAFDIGIEYNGMFWHSEQNNVDKYYHLNKTIMANNIGIFLIHVFETEWITRKKQIVSHIRKCIGSTGNIIGLDDLEVREITEIEIMQFLLENTINEFESVMEKRFGGFYNDELVVVMTTETHNDKIIVNKFYEKMDVGFSGSIFNFLLDYVISSKEKQIYCYLDRRYHDHLNNYLIESGFSFEGGTDPELWYCKNLVQKPFHAIHKNNVMSYISVYDDALSIYENMILNGYLTIWDCGKLVYKKTRM